MGLRDAVTRKLGRFTDTSQSPQTVKSTHPRRTGIEIAGVFIFIGVLAIVGAGLRANETKASTGSAAKSTTPSSLDMSVDTQEPAAPLSGNAGDVSSNSVSTSINSSTNASGTTDTNVTVNGQPVEVPNNGSTQQTITTPNGSTTTVNVSNGNTGHGYNHSSSYTNVHSSSTSSSYTSGGNR